MADRCIAGSWKSAPTGVRGSKLVEIDDWRMNDTTTSTSSINRHLSSEHILLLHVQTAYLYCNATEWKLSSCFSCLPGPERDAKWLWSKHFPLMDR